jgi:hypothetical protein
LCTPLTSIAIWGSVMSFKTVVPPCRLRET